MRIILPLNSTKVNCTNNSPHAYIDISYIAGFIKGRGYEVKACIGTSSVYPCSLPRVGYVYLLCKGDLVVYIGASGDPKRIGAHQKTKCFDSVYYALCVDGQHWVLETILIRRFKTFYNLA